MSNYRPALEFDADHSSDAFRPAVQSECRILPIDSEFDMKQKALDDLFNSSESNWKRLVELYSDSINENVRREIISRFNLLLKLDDWDLDDIPVTRESAQTFMEVLKALNPEVPPFITCDGNGNVTMFWGDKNEHISFKCYPENTVALFIVYKRNDFPVEFCGTKHVTEIIQEMNEYEAVRTKLLGC